MSHPNEAMLLARAQKGEDDAFGMLVELYQRPVYNLCYRMMGNPSDAEDSAQETFIRAYKAIHRYDPARKFSSWLLTIASNYCIDQHRRRKLATFSFDALPVPDLPDNNTPGVEASFLQGEHSDTVRVLLEELAPKDRAAIVLRYWYDYSYEEIADSLEITVSAVKSRLHRARKDLAAAWLENQPQPTQLERTQHELPAL